jgi:serine/threonine protein kinase
MTHYSTQTGQEIVLKQRLDFGGEGGVWLTDFPETVAKIYHHPQETYAQKLQYMVENPPHDPMLIRKHRSIAWPQELLKDAQGKFAGFLMPRVSGALQLNHIYNAKLRRRSAPGFTWYYLHVAAMNLASIMAALHDKGYVVGDLKTDNFLVTDRALVSIIDTDSFQIKTSKSLFKCAVGSEGFMPPELIGVSLDSIERTIEQDAFGLGILIHLILLGYHPFSGDFSLKNIKEPLSRDEAILKGISIYQEGFHASLPPYVVEKEALHPLIHDTFVQCFKAGQDHPEKRPTAATWVDVLKKSLRDLHQCGTSVQHFYFGKHCGWCDRLARTGIDVFAGGEHVQTLAVDFQLQKALNSQDLREMARLWQMHPTLQQNPRFQMHQDFIRKAIAYVEALDQFKAFCEDEPTDEEILTWWLDHDALSHFPHNPHERIHNRSLHEFLKEVRERNKAFDQLNQAIKQATSIDSMGNSPLSEPLEKAIVDAYDAYRWIDPFKKKHKEIFDRVHEARQNLDIWSSFQNSHKKGDDQKLLALWREHYNILERFSLSGDHRQALFNAERAEKKLQEIQSILKESDSFDRIMLWWQKNPRFHKSSFKETIVKGLSIEGHALLATKQQTLLSKLQTAANAGDFQSLADLWDPEICEGFREFSFFVPLVKSAQKTYNTWQKVKRAVKEEQLQELVALWDEDHFSVPAQQEGLALEIQKQFQEAYRFVTFPKTEITALHQHKDFFKVYWEWPAKISDQVLCIIGTKTTEDYASSQGQGFDLLYTARKKGSVGDALIPGLLKPNHKVYLWVGQRVCGKLLTFGTPLVLQQEAKKEVFYTINFANKWQGWRHKFSSTILIEICSSHDITLPPLSLKGVAGRPPIYQDGAAKTILSIPSLSLKANEKKTLSFLQEDTNNRLMQYRLDIDPTHKFDGDFLEAPSRTTPCSTIVNIFKKRFQ